MTQPHILSDLRAQLAHIEATDWGKEPKRFSLGHSALDEAVGGGLPRGALHEIFAAEAGDAAAAAGFTLGLGLRAQADPRRRIVWIRQDMAAREGGRLYPPGLSEFGADPAIFIQVTLRDAVQVLRAAHECLRCEALGAVLIEPWGEPKTLDLTASRRLSRAAAASGVAAFLLRPVGVPEPSAALSRWRVAAAPSQPLEADAPGLPSFRIDLLRHRAGFPPQSFRVEWDRDELAFREPAFSRHLAAPSADRPAAPAQVEDWRRAG